MRLPPLKLQGVLVLIAAGTVGYWLGEIGPTVLLAGVVVFALATVSLRKRGRVAGEIKAGGGRLRLRSLSGLGLVGYSIAVALAFAWLAIIWTWQVYEHEAFKLRQSTAPVAKARP